MRARLIPILLLDGSKLVKTIRFENPSYVGDPINALRIFNEKEVDELCILDISKDRKKNGPNFYLLEQIVSEGFMPIACGGGISSITDIRKLFNIGVEKVVLNTAIFENPEIIREAADIFGEQSILLSFDIKMSSTLFGKKKYEIYTESGKKKILGNYIHIIKEKIELGAGEVLINSIDNDGNRNGLDINLLESIVEEFDIPIIGCGGVGNLEHIKDGINKAKLSAIAAGSYFVYHGKHRAVLITYPDHDKLDYIFKN